MIGGGAGSRASRWWFGSGGTALLLITLAVVSRVIDRLDAWVLLYFAARAGRHVWLMAAMETATAIGDAGARLTIALVVAALLALYGRRRPALFLAVTMLSAWAASSLFKLLIARPRPELLPHLDVVNTHSFPSGHAWNGMALCLALALVTAPLLRPRARPWLFTGAIAGAIMIGLSRLALAVHWPSDVLAGWIGGALWVMLMARLFQLDGYARGTSFPR